MATILLITALPGSTASDIQLEIAPHAFSQDGILILNVAFHSTADVTVYSWRGHIYPLLGYGLSVDARDRNGAELSVEPVEKILPKLPGARDVATASRYEYPEPLVLQVRDSSGRPFQGCLNVQITYDVTADSGRRYSAVGLDLLRVRSNTVSTCNAR